MNRIRFAFQSSHNFLPANYFRVCCHFCLLSRNIRMRIQNTFAWPVVLSHQWNDMYWGYQKQRNRLVPCENRGHRNLFEPRTEQMAGGCRKLHNEKLHNFYFFFHICHPSVFLLSHIISLLSVTHTIYSIMQTEIQGLHVSTVYGHLQALFLN